MDSLPAAEHFAGQCRRLRCGTVLADPPWQFSNRTGKAAPEHRRLNRYATLTLGEIKEIPVTVACAEQAHLYLWVPNALLQEGLDVMRCWGFDYKTNLVWHKIRKDGGPDGRGVGFYFRNTTELVLFGVRGSLRTLPPGRTQVNMLKTRKREHSRKPDELYDIIEACSPGPYLEMFARGQHSPKWKVWGDQSVDYQPSWPTYKNHSGPHRQGACRRMATQIVSCPVVSILSLPVACESGSLNQPQQFQRFTPYQAIVANASVRWTFLSVSVPARTSQQSGRAGMPILRLGHPSGGASYGWGILQVGHPAVGTDIDLPTRSSWTDH